jgi:hypothetical protein
MSQLDKASEKQLPEEERRGIYKGVPLEPEVEIKDNKLPEWRNGIREGLKNP